MKISKNCASLLLIFLVTGCGSNRIGLNDSVCLKNKSELLHRGGKPHVIKEVGNGDEWIYNYSSFSMFNFEKRTYYYRYLIDDNGKIVEQTAIENIYRSFSNSRRMKS